MVRKIITGIRLWLWDRNNADILNNAVRSQLTIVRYGGQSERLREIIGRMRLDRGMIEGRLMDTFILEADCPYRCTSANHRHEWQTSRDRCEHCGLSRHAFVYAAADWLSRVGMWKDRSKRISYAKRISYVCSRNKPSMGVRW